MFPNWCVCSNKSPTNNVCIHALVMCLHDFAPVRQTGFYHPTCLHGKIAYWLGATIHMPHISNWTIDTNDWGIYSIILSSYTYLIFILHRCSNSSGKLLQWLDRWHKTAKAGEADKETTLLPPWLQDDYNMQWISWGVHRAVHSLYLSRLLLCALENYENSQIKPT